MFRRVLLEKFEEGCSVPYPTLPCRGSQGKTDDEAIENITDAIEDYLFVLNK